MHYALRGEHYPIETPEQVKVAEFYFNNNIKRFSPSDRVEVATNLEKRAEALGCDLNADWVTNYSRMMKKEASYSPDFERNMKTRQNMCTSHGVEMSIGGNMVKAAELIQKLVSEKETTPPIEMVAAVSEFDKMAKLEAHYDTGVMDPVFTVFGSAHNPDFDMKKVAGVDESLIKQAALNDEFMEKLSSMFGEAFANDFRQSPVAIFASMPAPEQQLIKEAVDVVKGLKSAARYIKGKAQKYGKKLVDTLEPSMKAAP